jgi:hypothetical protein
MVWAGAVPATSGPCRGAYRLLRSGRCTHGPDPAPKGVDVRKPVPLAPPSRPGPSARLAQACEGDGQSGLRVQVVYARAADVTDGYSTVLPTIRAAAQDASDIFNASAAETGGSRHIRFVHDAGCEITVANVTLSATGDDTFDNTVVELAAQGYNRADRKYMVFVDAFVYCGFGHLSGGDQPGPEHPSNSGSAYGRSDRGCWNGPTAAHELNHNIGGVQPSVPHASGGWHCVDEWDVMCYSDQPDFPAMQILCPDSSHDARLDCNHDDYYHSSPPRGSYLYTHWNTADSMFLSGGAKWGYVWADSPTADDYEPASWYQRNSTGAANRITHLSVGNYQVRFTNLGTWTGNGGTVDVTAYDFTNQHCKVGSWYASGTDLLVNVNCYTTNGVATDALFTASFVSPTQDPGDIAYVWADSPTASSYTPASFYQFNATGASNTISRWATGRYVVTMPGMGTSPGGHVKVTAYGWDSASCGVLDWNSVGTAQEINVMCVDASGSYVDTYFTATFVRGVSVLGVNGGESGYVFGTSPSTESYPVNNGYGFNSTGATNTITRLGAGEYRVTFPGLTRGGGHVQVTAAGDANRRCKVTNWGTDSAETRVYLRCFTLAGSLADAFFVASYNR